MKKTLSLIRLSALMLFVVVMCSGKEDCNTDPLYGQALGMLKNYNLLKDYRVHIKKKKKNDPIESVFFPITLNRDVKYKFYCLSVPQAKGKMVLTIYSSMKREFTVATTYNPATQTAHESIEFLSHRTGNFCVGFYFMNGEDGCGLGMSSFLK